jgi:hypothetical protein
MREKRFWTWIAILLVAGIVLVLGGGRWLWHLFLAMHGRR